jgi:hypothetical protein
VTDINVVHHVIIRILGLVKFMVFPHYTYHVLKMLGHNGVINVRGDIKQSYACDKEGCSRTESQVMELEEDILKDAFKHGHREGGVEDLKPL